MISAKEIDALLPQTQCGECGYMGCMPYAEALAAGIAPINLCPPGGVETLKALGQRLTIDPGPYLTLALENTRLPTRAFIREAECIGCTKCIQACPVDAIIGAGKLMHSVLEDACTGCGLCVEPCPVDCIEMLPLQAPAYDKQEARQRFEARAVRMLRDEHEKQQAYRDKRKLVAQTMDEQHDKHAKQDYILQAMRRVHAKKHE